MPENLTPCTVAEDDPIRRQSATWTCDDCGQDVEPFTWELGDTIRYIMRQFCDCPVGQTKKAAYEEDLAHHEWQKTAEALIEPLNIGDYVNFTFTAWRPDNGNARRVFDHVNEYVNQVEDKGDNWLYLYGEYGLGKTHLAIAALRKVAAIRLWQPHVIVWPELCQATQESWGSSHGPTEAALWGRARSAKILLIDDLDKTSTGEWAMSKLYGLINHRLHYEKPTIITANRSIQELQAEWKESPKDHVRDTGMAILSRIRGPLWANVEFKGQDQR